MFALRKGATGIQYVGIVSVLSLSMLALFYMLGNRVFPLCDGIMKVVCETNIQIAEARTGGSGGDGGGTVPDAPEPEPVSDYDPGAIGHPDYDPDPSTTIAGAWVYGAGQAFNADADYVVYPGDIDEDLDRYDYASPTLKHPNVPMIGSYDTGSGATTHNAWFAETRMIELDQSVDCSAQAVGYCQGFFTMPLVMLQQRLPGGPVAAFHTGIEETLDFGTVYIGSHDPLHVRQGGDKPSDAAFRVGLKLEIIAESNNLSLTNFSTQFPDTTIRGKGHEVSIGYQTPSYLTLAEGAFEVGNGYQAAYRSADTVHGARYVPDGGGVVAAYPRTDIAISDAWAAPQHLIDLRHATGWSIAGCGVDEVPFIRDNEPSDGYAAIRASQGYTDPRGGASVTLQNGSATWKIVFVDRAPVPDVDCDVSNPDIFVQH